MMFKENPYASISVNYPLSSPLLGSSADLSARRCAGGCQTGASLLEAAARQLSFGKRLISSSMS
jgi:hypothetical protein